jgi:hypothetical protein
MNDTTMMVLTEKARGRIAPSFERPVALINVPMKVGFLEINGG